MSVDIYPFRSHRSQAQVIAGYTGDDAGRRFMARLAARYAPLHALLEVPSGDVDWHHVAVVWPELRPLLERLGALAS